MKIIEALKKTKDLKRKADDIRDKLKNFCADLDADTPAYETPERQKSQIAEWLQSIADILKEIERLRIGIQKTNLATEVPVEVADGKIVTKSIAAWIHRRKDLATLEAVAWKCLTDRNLQPKNYTIEGSNEFRVANVRKYYNQKERDEKVEDFTSEPSRIDAALEVVNATTDIVD